MISSVSADSINACGSPKNWAGGGSRKTWRRTLSSRALRTGKGGRGRSSENERGVVRDEAELVSGGSSCKVSCEGQVTCYTPDILLSSLHACPH